MTHAAAVGVDIGTGAARAVAIDPEGSVLGTASACYVGSETWPPGRARAEAWRQACLAALGRLASATPAATRPAAVAIGGQSPTTVGRDGGLVVTVRHPAGNDGDAAARQQAQRAVIDAERDAACQPRQLWDWLCASLGGDDVQARWPRDATLEGFGELGGSGDVVGAVGVDHAAPGLPAGTPLVGGAQDAYLAFWAGGVSALGRGMDPGGRTGGLAAAVTAGVTAEGLWSFASAARGVDVCGGPVNAHGIAIEWLARLLSRPVDELLAAAAEVPPGAGGVLVLPYLEGERAPRWDAGLRGAVVGLDAGVGPAELTRAVLEGTALGLAHIACGLRAAGAELEVVVCAGQPARSELWCGIKAAALGVEVEVCDDCDLAAFGAALAAGAGAGWWPKPGEGSGGDWPLPPLRRVTPIDDGGVYAALLERFVAAGDATQRLPAIFGSNSLGSNSAITDPPPGG